MADMRKNEEIKKKCNKIPIDSHQFILFFIIKSTDIRFVELVMLGKLESLEAVKIM